MENSKKNGDNTIAAYRLNVDCCKIFITIFLFLLFSMCNCAVNWCDKLRFYRAMHFIAKRGIAIACRLSVCPSVCLWRWWIVIT